MIIPNLVYIILVVVSNCVKLKISLKQVFPETSITRFGTLRWSQQGENSVRYSQTTDNQDTKRTSFPDQPFGLGDSWSAGKFRTFQALFSRPAEFGPYIYKCCAQTFSCLFCDKLMLFHRRWVNCLRCTWSMPVSAWPRSGVTKLPTLLASTLQGN